MSGRETVEACRSIDVNRLHRAGCLCPGWNGGWEWTAEGERVAWINLRAEEGLLHLLYRVRIFGRDWQSIEETVRIVRAPCHFGGERPYFICPGIVNRITYGQRFAKLYQAKRYFLCRRCYRLADASQSKAGWDRPLRRANKLRRRLGGEPGMASPIPQKPKGMWHRTYNSMLDRIAESEASADEHFMVRLCRLWARLNNRNGFYR